MLVSAKKWVEWCKHLSRRQMWAELDTQIFNNNLKLFSSSASPAPAPGILGTVLFSVHGPINKQLPCFFSSRCDGMDVWIHGYMDGPCVRRGPTFDLYLTSITQESQDTKASSWTMKCAKGNNNMDNIDNLTLQRYNLTFNPCPINNRLLCCWKH